MQNQKIEHGAPRVPSLASKNVPNGAQWSGPDYFASTVKTCRPL
jgi:hypothetical protein